MRLTGDIILLNHVTGMLKSKDKVNTNKAKSLHSSIADNCHFDVLFCRRLYLVSCFEADPPHVSLLRAPAGHQSDHLLLGRQGTVLGASLGLAALLQQGNLLLAQEVVRRVPRGRHDLCRCARHAMRTKNLLGLPTPITRAERGWGGGCISSAPTVSSSCLAVVCSVIRNTVKSSGPGAPYTVTRCCRGARLSSELNSCVWKVKNTTLKVF